MIGDRRITPITVLPEEAVTTLDIRGGSLMTAHHIVAEEEGHVVGEAGEIEVEEIMVEDGMPRGMGDGRNGACYPFVRISFLYAYTPLFSNM